MANKYTTLAALFKAIADSIRNKTGKTGEIVADNFPNEIDAIEVSSGADTSDATAVAGDILKGKIAYGASGKITGTIESKAAERVTPSTTTKIISGGQYLAGDLTIVGDNNLTAGNIKSGVTIFETQGTYTSDANATADDILDGKTAYVNGAKVTGNIGTVTQPTPAISVNSSTGVVTATSTLSSSGYVESGTKTKTYSLPTQGTQTITPDDTDQTIPAGKYLTGAQTIKGDSNLTSGNIKDGVTLFGITGSYSGKSYPNGISWEVSKTFTGTIQYGPVSCHNTTILVSSGYIYVTSDHGATWTRKTSASTLPIAMGDGWWICGNKYTIDDGKTWSTSSGFPAEVAYHNTSIPMMICGGGGVVVAIGKSSTSSYTHYVYYSVNNGANYIKSSALEFDNSPTGGLYYSNSGGFIIQDSNGTQPKIYYSRDGINWTESTVPSVTTDNSSGTTFGYYGTCYGNGRWISFVDGTSTLKGRVLYSTDKGATWKITTSWSYPWRGDIDQLFYLNGKFFVTGNVFNTSEVKGIGCYSTDGITWTSESGSSYISNAYCACVGHGVSVISGAQANGTTKKTWYTKDGTKWYNGQGYSFSTISNDGIIWFAKNDSDDKLYQSLAWEPGPYNFY